MVLRIYLILLLTVLSGRAFAEIKITAINRNTYSTSSGKFFGQVNATVTNINGGTSGSDCSGSNTSAVCDSCAITPTTESCNSKRIYDNLDFQVTILYTTTDSIPRQILVTSDLNSNNSQVVLIQTDSPGFVTGGSFNVKVKWKEICKNIGKVSTSCDVSFSNKVLRIGVDANADGFLDDGEYNNELRFSVNSLTTAGGDGLTTFCKMSDTTLLGACNFTAYPGDKKVYIDNVRANSSFPTIDGSTITAIRVYYQKASLGGSIDQAITSTTPIDLPLSGKNISDANSNAKIIGLSSNEVSGLENNVSYNFAIGVVDAASNVGLVTQFTSPDVLTNCYDDSGAESLNRNCHVATPEPINGLSNPEDEFDCFITTAAYGSPFKPKVQTFRKFRNVFLKTHFLGNYIIQKYYQFSPPLADWIRQHPKSKLYVRILLWPLWIFAKVCLEMPYVFFILLLTPFLLLRLKNKRELV